MHVLGLTSNLGTLVNYKNKCNKTSVRDLPRSCISQQIGTNHKLEMKGEMFKSLRLGSKN